jgi:hypothetical protein
VGHTLKKIYIDLPGYLEASHHRENYIDMSCESGGCKIFIDDIVIDFFLIAEGQLKYRIISNSSVHEHHTKDFPPNDYDVYHDCFFNVRNHNLSFEMNEAIIKDIEVIGTDLWCFDVRGFDKELASRAAKKNDLPGEVWIKTDCYRVHIILDDLEYFRLDIVPN